ncbi:hypothetical protein CAMSH0001_1446 [Campylobacter showae RM3277]|uniref:Uncharacterized protein n=1 Tax=Campylobacter showae RM3277 TaxID=553219 RepID=C6RIU9_9BACT|nr:hypothetical protein CAMSH0001_1446 [Campylobacter showae RM3277]
MIYKIIAKKVGKTRGSRLLNFGAKIALPPNASNSCFVSRSPSALC